MALATRCPHCQTTFRVANDQLKLHAGLVRCGACHQTFNGIEHLVPPDQALRPATPAAPATPVVPPDAPAAASAAHTEIAANAPAAFAAPADTIASAEPVVAAGTTSESQDVPDIPVSTAAFTSTVSDEIRTDEVPAAERSESIVDDSLFAASEAPQVWTHPKRIPPAGDISPDAALSFPEPEIVSASAEHEPEETSPQQANPLNAPEANAAEREEALNIASASEIEFDLGDDMPSMMAEPVAAERAPEQDLAMQIELETRAALAEPQIDWSVSDSAGELPVEPEPDPEATLAALDLSLPEPPPVAEIADPETTPAESLAATTATNEAEHDDDKPDFVLQAERAARRGRVMTIVYSLLILILLPLCLGQLAIVNRNSLAAHYPQTLPLLKQVCAPLHCEIRLPARIDQISIEANELQSLDADRNLFQLNVQLLNTSSAPMAWPHLELQLNDSKDKPVILKSFAPKDYLPEGTDAVKGIAGHGDQQVKIYFELSTSKASGYHVAAFYP
ncbi:DUF3426 domain-containing protein [Undibacterium squillarum]|uniref:Zinc finger/thioredoxin putative domain-containing protein n=1 Tax=Undibacterium squillarum TaxID=1131567 RepID=A0ABQ2XYE5_9BURK|nr:DUF3426 domain-containing protein [Undibacterium squillarum]GGX41127.1 hypothetical protein GCM10010946_19470 [Undibacterium squillarum]